MGIPTLTRSWNRSVPYPQMTGRWLLRAAGLVFVELIACGSLTLNSSAGHGSEGSLTNLSRSQAVELPNNEDEIQQRIPIVPNLFLLIFPLPILRLDWIRWTTGIKLTPGFPSVLWLRR